MFARPRPLLTAILIGLFAELLFLWGIATPHHIVFDEVHYVAAARTLIALAGPVNAEHPLVAKEMIAGGMLLFGDNSFGWRIMPSIAGMATLMSVFAIVWLLYRRIRPAVMASIFVLLNFTLYIEARIAMIDPFLAAFTVGGIAATLWAMRARPGQAWPRWILAGILLGLAVATKWAAAPYLIYVAIGFAIVRVRDAMVAERPILSALSGRDQPHWAGLPLIPAIAVMAVVSIATYFLTFAPAFFYLKDPMTLAGLIPFQQEMYALQTQVLPRHTYQSSWWTWPFLIRPIWYLYEQTDGAMRGILMLGNPVLMWGGLLAVLACLWGWVSARDPKLLFAAALWAGSYFVWAIIPKSLGFYYYYYLPSIFICIVLAAAFDHFCRGRFRHWDEGYAVFAFGVAVYFFPIISGGPLSNDQAFHHWTWFRSWQ